MTAPKPYLRLILILSGIFFLLHVVFLGVAPLWGSSEAREAQVVWTIFSFDEWILPLRNGIIPSKPPLFHWLGTLLSYGLGDVTLFSVRLVSLLAATGTLFVTLYTTAILWVRERQAPPTLPILVAWFCMITTYIFLVSAGDAKVDMLFTFWVTCAVAWYLRATRYELIEGASEDLGKAYAGMWLFCALAALTKGPLGFVLPLLLCFAARWHQRSFSAALKEFALPRISTFIAVLAVATWYWAAYMQGGEPFLNKHLLFENVERITGGKDMNSAEWWYYFPSFLTRTFPWAILAAVFFFVKLYRKQLLRNEMVGFVITIVGLIFFSIPSGKRHTYLLPLIPWFVLSASFLFSDVLQNLSPRWRLLSSRALVGFTILGGAVLSLALLAPHALLFISYTPRSVVLVHSLGEVSLIVQWAMLLFIVVGSVILRCAPYSIPRTVVTALLPFAFLFTAGTYIGLAIKGDLKGFNRMAEEALLAAGDEKITILKDDRDEYFDPIFYYFRKRVAVARSVDDAHSGVFLAHSKEPQRWQGCEPAVLKKFSEIPKSFDSVSGRELMLFRCG